MLITAYFSENGTPKTGLSPTLDIIDLSDGSLAVDDGAMTERASAFYTYNFAGYDAIKNYSVICDSVTLTGPERYAIAGIESYLGTDGNVLVSANAQDLSGSFDINAKALGGTVQSATDLKDFADEGYDPITNKVEGVKLVDTTITNSDMRGTDGANTIVPDAAGTAPTAIEIRQEMDSNSVDFNAIIAYLIAIKAKTDNLPSGIAKNIALNNFEFVMVDSEDSKTPLPGLSVTCRISLDGAAFQGSANAASEVGGGLYKINFTQAERNAVVATYEFTAEDADARIVTIISPV